MKNLDTRYVNFGYLCSRQDVYKLPFFQRTYSWKEIHWETLFNDIINLEENEEHYMNTIIVLSSTHKTGINSSFIIDGQQRMATIMILLGAARDLSLETGNKLYADHIEETLFAMDWINDKDKKKIPRLELGIHDNHIFSSLLNGELNENSDSMIIKCYKYFKQRIQPDKISEIFKRVTENFHFVVVTTVDEVLAWKIFVTINSKERGLTLGNVDQIKSFLLIKLSKKEDIKNQSINEWDDMYKKIPKDEHEDFIRRYFLSGYKGIFYEEDIYKMTRKLEKKDSNELLDILKDLNVKATIYRNILDVNFNSAKLNRKLKDLHYAQANPSFTLLLKIIPLYENGPLSEEILLKILDLILIVHIRIWICRIKTDKYDRIYNDICVELSELKEYTPDDIFKIIKKRFDRAIQDNASDDIFEKSFINYSTKQPGSRMRFLLYKLSKPTGENIPDFSEIDMEHIIPRSKNEDWINYLKNKTCKDERYISAAWEENIDKIGNLTIIKGKINKSMKNELFERKKEKYKKSEFLITREISNFEDFTFDKINERSKMLSERSLEVFKWI